MELKSGDSVEFIYHGSIDEFVNTKQEGTIVMVPHIQWQGGTVPVEGYIEPNEIFVKE